MRISNAILHLFRLSWTWSLGEQDSCLHIFTYASWGNSQRLVPIYTGVPSFGILIMNEMVDFSCHLKEFSLEVKGGSAVEVCYEMSYPCVLCRCTSVVNACSRKTTIVLAGYKNNYVCKFSFSILTPLHTFIYKTIITGNINDIV